MYDSVTHNGHMWRCGAQGEKSGETMEQSAVQTAAQGSRRDERQSSTSKVEKQVGRRQAKHPALISRSSRAAKPA